jgi:hypothetical protein
MPLYHPAGGNHEAGSRPRRATVPPSPACDRAPPFTGPVPRGGSGGMGVGDHPVRRLHHRRKFYGQRYRRQPGRSGRGELRARPRLAGHPGNPVRTLLRVPADEGHRRGDVRRGNPLRPGHPLPPPGGDLPVSLG